MQRPGTSPRGLSRPPSSSTKADIQPGITRRTASLAKQEAWLGVFHSLMGEWTPRDVFKDSYPLVGSSEADFEWR